MPADLQSRSAGESSSQHQGFVSTGNTTPPPIPPPPTNYHGGPIPRVSGLSLFLFPYFDMHHFIV